jgi:MFS family permease
MPPPFARVVFPLGVAQTISWGSTYYLPAILAGGMAGDTGASTPFVFGAFSAALLVSAFLSPVAGRLIDLHGGRRILAGSNVIFAAGLLMLANATGHASLAAGWLVVGIGMSCGLYEAAFSTLAGIYGAEARRPITGITLIAGFASTICWPISAWLDSRYGWRTTCIVWAAVHILAALPLNLLLPQAIGAGRKHDKAAEVPPVPHRRAIMAALAFVFAATWFCSTAMAAHLPRLLQEAGATLAVAIAAAALVGPAQVAARVLEFWVMRHAHPVVTARMASLSHSVGAAGLVVFGVPLAPFFTIAHGAGNGIMTIANGTLPLKYFGPGGYGLRQGLLMVPARVLQAAAPFAFDLALSNYGLGSLALTAGLGICSFVVLMFLPGPAAPRLDPARGRGG